MAQTTPRHGKRKDSHMTHSKPCTKCGQTKPLDDFAKHKHCKGGLAGYCKECAVARASAWFANNKDKATDYRKSWAQNNPEKIALYKKHWYQANPEKIKEWQQSNPEKVKAIHKAWREANPEKISTNSKAYRQANPEKVSAYARQWAKSNPERRNFNASKRRALKLNNGVSQVTLKELQRLYASHCAYCAAPSEHIDHVIPLSRGGTHSIGNLTGACASCNLSKGAKFITEWKKEKTNEI